MTEHPHLQKCAGAEWKQQEPLKKKTKKQKKMKPNQKTTTSTNQLTKNKTSQILSLWQTLKANCFVDALHRRPPKMRARGEASAEPQNDQALPFYPHQQLFTSS